MRILAQICLLCISMLLCGKTAQHNEAQRYRTVITMKNGAAISGISIFVHEGGEVKGCLFNEFGVTAIEFTYDTTRHKVKLHHVIKMLDKWYIKRVLRKDLRCVIEGLQRGEMSYHNERRHISYEFSPINESDDGATQ